MYAKVLFSKKLMSFALYIRGVPRPGLFAANVLPSLYQLLALSAILVHCLANESSFRIITDAFQASAG
jgi:hypothetical protein